LVTKIKGFLFESVLFFTAKRFKMLEFLLKKEIQI
jgi:hypothetical protein